MYSVVSVHFPSARNCIIWYITHWVGIGVDKRLSRSKWASPKAIEWSHGYRDHISGLLLARCVNNGANAVMDCSHRCTGHFQIGSSRILSVFYASFFHSLHMSNCKCIYGITVFAVATNVDLRHSLKCVSWICQVHLGFGLSASAQVPDKPALAWVACPGILHRS